MWGTRYCAAVKFATTEWSITLTAGPAGVTQVSYSLATMTPGTFSIVPGDVSLAYAPEVRAAESFGTANIVDYAVDH